MMRKLKNYLIRFWARNPIIFIAILILIILTMQDTIYKVLSLIVPKEIAQMIIASSFLLAVGLMGIFIIIRKEVFFLGFRIQGFVAKALGLFFIAFGFGATIWGILGTIFSLKLP
jgi:hypothetical protein